MCVSVRAGAWSPRRESYFTFRCFFSPPAEQTGPCASTVNVLIRWPAVFAASYWLLELMQHSLVEQQVIYVCASNDSVDGEKLIYVDPRQRDEVCACFVPGYFANESIVLVFISISIFQVSSWWWINMLGRSTDIYAFISRSYTIAMLRCLPYPQKKL